MTKIWQKSKSKSNPVIEKYNTGDDYLMDMEIFPFDIIASSVHAEMLGKIGVLSSKEVKSLVNELNAILKNFNDGKIKIKVEDEDCHTVIENLLIKKLGDVGKKIHTGRSRNDQVLTAVRLYTINKLKTISTLNKELISVIISFAEKNKNSPLPG